MNSRRSSAVARWVMAFGALAGIVVAYRHWVHVNPTTVALTLLLFVLTLAALWELRYAVVISIAATAAYNFYFLPPLGTFRISDPQNWLALFAFLGTSIVGSRLSQKARGEAATAQRQRRELEVLYRLSRELLQTESVADALQTVPSLINASAVAESVVLYLLDGERVYQTGLPILSRVEMTEYHQLAMTLPAAEAVAGNEIRVPLRSSMGPRGLLVIRGASLTMESLEAVGGLVSITLDHAQAIEEAARSEASKESERLRTLILDSITHELRTPLTSIKGAAGALLADEQMAGEDRKELLSVVDEEADRLNRLIGQAVEMAQIETQEVRMRFEPLRIADLFELAREDCEWVENSHPLSVDLEDVPAVLGDREMLGKVFCNLLENAAKYSASASPIFVSAIARNGFVETSVADRGVGIDAAEHGLIFDRLYRSRTQTERTSGTGMGLAICRAIIDAHHGALNVTSQLGRGSVFTFSLPLADTSSRVKS